MGKPRWPVIQLFCLSLLLLGASAPASAMHLSAIAFNSRIPSIWPLWLKPPNPIVGYDTNALGTTFDSPRCPGFGSYSEDFSTTTYLDAAVTNASGWGSGQLTLGHQQLHVIGVYDTASIARAVGVVGNIAYLTDRDSGLQILNITNPASPSLLGSFDTLGFAYSVTIEGPIVYLADYGVGVQIVNATDTAHPTLLSTYPLAYSRHLAVRGGLAYIAAETAGLQVLNVSDPRHPQFLGSYVTSGTARDVVVVGSLAYVAEGISGLQILNVSNPFLPTLLSTFDTSDYAYGVDVVGALAYIANYASGLQVLNVSDPRHPQILGSYDTNGESQDVVVAGGLAYIADHTAGLQVLNVSNPRHPQLIGSCDAFSSAYGVAVAERMVYIADEDAGLQILKITDPAIPTLLANYVTPGAVYRTTVVGSLAYIADGASGVEVLNVTDPRHPQLLGSYVTPHAARDVAVVGSLAYVADGWSGLQVLNVSDPRHPLLIGSYALGGDAQRVVVEGSIAYVANEVFALQLLNVTDPRHPVLLGTYSTSGAAMDVIVVGAIAYIADSIGALLMVNVTDPRHPVLLGSYPMSTQAFDVVGSLAYIANGGGGLLVLNVTDPRHPAPLGTYTGSYVLEVAVTGTLAYISDDYARLHVLNVTDPWHPHLLSDSSIENIHDIRVEGCIAFIASLSYGVQLVEVMWPWCRQYDAQAVAQSVVVFDADPARIVSATVTAVQLVPAEAVITYYLSADGGLHWEPISLNLEHIFTYSGTLLRWRGILSTAHPLITPTITSLHIVYHTQLDAPLLLTPSEGTHTNDSTPTFQWNSVPGAIRYLLQLDTANSFDSPNLHNISATESMYTLVTPLADGQWYWRVAANDSQGDLGKFAAHYELFIDATAPTWDEPPTDQTIEFGSEFHYDLNASDPSTIDHYWINDTDHFSIDSTGVISNLMVLPVNIYPVEVRAYDSYGNHRSTTFTVTVQDTQPPNWILEPTDQVLSTAQLLEYQLHATDLSGIDHWTINDTTHFIISSSGLLSNAVPLAVGRYGLRVTAYDPYSNALSATFSITVQEPTTPPPPPPIPGFPLAAIGLGAIMALAPMIIARRRRTSH